ncbi:MAG: hypothetical protein CM1200mP26_11960 [Acidimicrobiales bacterium]|nr:MAG: hypothetical protein CM1200mP26_11960 [Acidimicrobiales bacterium]
MGTSGHPGSPCVRVQVSDVHEWLAADPRRAALQETMGLDGPGSGDAVIVQDPCHLRHAQGCHGAVREVLAPHISLVELDDEGLCCGAGGAYSVVQPALAAAVRERKVAAVPGRRTEVERPWGFSANPGWPCIWPRQGSSTTSDGTSGRWIRRARTIEEGLTMAVSSRRSEDGSKHAEELADLAIFASGSRSTQVAMNSRSMKNAYPGPPGCAEGGPPTRGTGARTGDLCGGPATVGRVCIAQSVGHDGDPYPAVIGSSHLESVPGSTGP